MILSALAVIYINTPESQAQGEAAVSGAYNVYGDASAQESTGGQVSAALVNSLVIVSVICAMTFVIVLLYKYRCMKILITYMVVATGMLLGYISSIMFQVAIDRYSLTIDKVSFWLFIYNFAIVGTLAIFFGRGFPVYVQQGYLIANSVIVAWQLSYFDSWTAWALLIMLALYDLFAVLSPCGPLKALVKLMQRDNAPEMPGLLYEASLPQQQQQSASNPDQPHPPSGAAAPPTPEPHPSAVPNAESTVAPTGRDQSQAEKASASTADESSGKRRPYGQQELNNKPEVSPCMDEACQPPPSLVAVATASGDVELAPLCMTNGGGGARDEAPSDDGKPRVDIHQEGLQRQSLTTGPVDVDEPPVAADNTAVVAPQAPTTAHVPLALARMYKLRLVDNPRPRWLEAADQRQHQSSSGDVDEEDPQPPAPVVEPEYTPDELNSLVHVVFPTNGGRIQAQEPQLGQEGEPVRYDVLDRHGVVRRTLVVRDGRVFRVVPVEVSDEDDADGKRARNSIKLGLGDFIFYSILVAEAAVYSYTTFVACTLVILDGLGMTLVLLAVYGKALPALPISIFLGVIFYLLTRYLIQPWIQSIFVAELYV
jgi:presenilin-like A22 family membrane protease